ncbi:LacI family DNA-binding transcriptional regulator [Sphingobium sp. HBC34]|uniref:LacI family DNA-binding transcriptional regulator n=1 Tax=Sphingobium cyanobacteriorum TaxID=3063954 RepID=A0ABT8ZIW9_9SPHN|nr:LacI family DNA-binding transcriptional regulator [Sphingobium sp. HBC34]MDO7834142.1 LacI family DNA-binding transcriptional regulator [Sphingobium sp. HBC34]
MSTIADVAARAGVSIKTVSKVLNGADTVRPRLKQRIDDAISDLDYRPALGARQLASGKSYIVTLLLAAEGGDYYSRMIMEMTRACARYGYHAMVETHAFDTDLQSDIELRLSCMPDAIVVAPPFSNNIRLIEKLAGLGIPFARIEAGDGGPGIRVPVPGRVAAREMTAHLIAQGHRRIGMLAAVSEDYPADDRRLGYLDALEDAGICPDPRLVVRTNFSFRSGVIAARSLLALADRPTAIFGGSDLAALGAMACAQDLGFRIPKDLAIAGFDNASDSRIVYPALTTVHQPLEEIIRYCVDAVLGKAQDAPDFPLRLIVRGSTGGAETIVDHPAQDSGGPCA